MIKQLYNWKLVKQRYLQGCHVSSGKSLVFWEWRPSAWRYRTIVLLESKAIQMNVDSLSQTSIWVQLAATRLEEEPDTAEKVPCMQCTCLMRISRIHEASLALDLYQHFVWFTLQVQRHENWCWEASTLFFHSSISLLMMQVPAWGDCV